MTTSCTLRAPIAWGSAGGNGGGKQGSQRWKGGIASCAVKRTGTNKDGQPYAIYTIKGKDGTAFDTFSDTHAEIAQAAMKSGAELEITFEKGQYGNDAKTVDPVLLTDAQNGLGAQ